MPDNPDLEQDPSMIAIFFAHQDIPASIPESGVYFRLINLQTEHDEALKERILSDFDSSMACTVGFEPKFAMIITWVNMTFPNRRNHDDLKTNTYQMLLATDEMMTIAMFNYEQIQWITHMDNYDGLKGPPAFVSIIFYNEFKCKLFLIKIDWIQRRKLNTSLRVRTLLSKPSNIDTSSFWLGKWHSRTISLYH